jgi:threonine dehydrogenase-like Zn-dependent dehydrogenase
MRGPLFLAPPMRSIALSVYSTVSGEAESDIVTPVYGPALVERPKPEPRNGEVLLAPLYCGVCGTDFVLTRECMTVGLASSKYPLGGSIILGHEFTARVIEGKGSGIREGDLVAVESIVACGTCVPCRRGLRDSCERVELIGLTLDGALAEFVTVPTQTCWSLSGLLGKTMTEDRVARLGALFEPFGCAFRALYSRAKPVHPGDNVLIYGGGFLASACASLSVLGGAAHVTVVDRDSSKLEWIRSVLPVDSPFLPVVWNDTDESCLAFESRPADVVVIADPSNPHYLTSATRAVGRGGTIVLLNRTSLGNITSHALLDKGASIVGSRGQSGDGPFERLLRLVGSGRLQLDKFITRDISLSEVPDLLRFQGPVWQPGKVTVNCVEP